MEFLTFFPLRPPIIIFVASILWVREGVINPTHTLEHENQRACSRSNSLVSQKAAFDMFEWQLFPTHSTPV